MSQDVMPAAGGGTASWLGGQAGAGGMAASGATGGGAGGSPPSLAEGGAPDAGAAGQSTPTDGGQTGATRWMPDAPRVLTTQATEASWYGKDPTQGLTVTPNGHVLLETAYKIYEIAGNKVSDYLTDVETLAAIGNHDGYGFGGLGLDQQGTVYATFSGSVIRSNGPHQLELWRAEPGSMSAPALGLSVLGHDDVIAFGTEGMWRITGETAPTPLMSFTAIGDTCPYPKISLAASGTFLLLRGCAMNGVESGLFDGSVVSNIRTLFKGTFPPSGTSSPAQFLCATTAPQGGFYLVVKQNADTQLYYLADDATESAGVSKVAISPSLDEASVLTGDHQSMRKCNITAALDGGLYLQSSEVLWRLEVKP